MSYKIPLFNLNYTKEEETAVIKTIRSKWISTGPQVERLENNFSEFLRIKHSIALTNCTAALHLALKILGIREKDEVIVPSLTFSATVNAIRYVNATPVFADITSYEDLSIDPIDIENKITPKTKAIIVMHYGGFACDMDKIMKLADKHKLFVIEDAAHAPGSEFKNKKLGTIGDFGCFSFFSNKNISCAEGGMLTTDNEEYARKALLLRSHGMTSLSYSRSKGHAVKYDVADLGFNYRMDDIRAALALVQFKKLNNDLKKRAQLRQIYLDNIGNLREIIIPYKNNLYKTSNYIFPVILKNSNSKRRDVIRKKLGELGIETSIHYPCVHKFSIYNDFKVSLPKTEYVSDNEITLPLFFDLTKNNIKYITKSLTKAVKKI
ncbi:MAG: DegT/DnrJ/EryC1/StrS family aminotransferase [Candidatus Omnitrophica bacterium]|nr:DegT/DnrJ/EryC1/StrS family aminotransferase [Candidatus Omnitrophota bacterium]